MLSKFLRRSHMYAALFLAPWLLMYVISTMAMNHRDLFVKRNAPAPQPLGKEREVAYQGSFPDKADQRTMARQILASLDLEGAFNVRRDGAALVISRNDLLTPRRITYTPADGKVLVERMPNPPHSFLERFHRRRGYDTGYSVDTVWAVTVDLFIAGMIFWALSGLWMWWEMKVTRRYGAVALVAGVLLFVVFVVTI